MHKNLKIMKQKPNFEKLTETKIKPLEIDHRALTICSEI